MNEQIVESIFSLAEKCLPFFAGALGFFGGRYFDKWDRDLAFKKTTIIEVNKTITLWSDLTMTKVPLKMVKDDNYFFAINDKLLEAKATLEVAGSKELNFAFDELQEATLGILKITHESIRSNSFDPEKGLMQFSGKPELEILRRAKANWINRFRKEIGVNKFKVKKNKNENQ